MFFSVKLHFFVKLIFVLQKKINDNFYILYILSFFVRFCKEYTLFLMLIFYEPPLFWRSLDRFINFFEIILQKPLDNQLTA